MDGRCTCSGSPTCWPGELVPPLVATIEIDRPQDEVFCYVTDPTTFAEWQPGVVGGSMEPGTTPALGSKCTTTRRIGGAERESTSQVTKLDPPTSWAVHGIDGPIRAIVNVTVEPVDGSAQSRVTIEVDFEGHGVGMLLVPLVVAAKHETRCPVNMSAGSSSASRRERAPEASDQRTLAADRTAPGERSGERSVERPVPPALNMRRRRGTPSRGQQCYTREMKAGRLPRATAHVHSPQACIACLRPSR